LLSPSTKAAYLRAEFSRAMQNQALGAALFNINPLLELQIRRAHRRGHHHGHQPTLGVGAQTTAQGEVRVAGRRRAR